MDGIPYDQIVKAHEARPDVVPPAMKDRKGGVVTLDDGSRRKVKPRNALSEHIAKSEAVKESTVPFTACRRVSKTNIQDVGPYDRVDQCRVCGVDVLYNVRHSQGKPHLCLPCFVYNAASDDLSRLVMPPPVEYSEADDAAFMEWMDAKRLDT